MTIDSVTAGRAPAAVTMDETVARIDLPRPLAPRDSVTIGLRFQVQVPKPFNRFGHAGDDYAVGQWYPKVAVYDDRGWHADPYHYFAEFYGDYGTFDVAITLPDRFWVGATGVYGGATGGDNEIPLLDRETARDSVTVRLTAVTADSLRGRWPKTMLGVETDLAGPKGEQSLPLELKKGEGIALRVPCGAPVHYSYAWNDSDKPPRAEADAGGRPGPLRLVLAARDTTVRDTIRALAPATTPADSALPSLKTVRFHAERVHDFAWVASPEYVRADTVWNGILIRALCYRSDQKAWRDQRAFTVSAMKFLSHEVGPYVWPSFVSAEAFMGGGAMEYPMLVMNEPDLPSKWVESLDVTIAHELGHSWFYGMLGSDERAFPWLDEGFTQYMEHRYGDWKYPDGLFKLRKLLPWTSPAREMLYDESRYLTQVFTRDEMPIATPAEGYKGYGQYAAGAYMKPALMLHALRGEIGDEKFHQFLRDYYRENLFQHPRPENVVRAAEHAAGFPQWHFFTRWIDRTGPPKEYETIPVRVRLVPLLDVPSSRTMPFVYGPMIWHGRAEGARLGLWTSGRYLASRDFPDGILGAGGNAVVGTRRGDFSYGLWGNKRVGALGARGHVKLSTARDAGLFRLGAEVGNFATAPGRRHPFRSWGLSLDYRDRYDMAPVDPRYWSPGRTLNGKGVLALDTQGPRRAEHLELDLRGGDHYERASLEVLQRLDLFPRADTHLRWRLFGGSAFDRPPREILLDAAEGARVDSTSRFYLNDRGPLLRSGHYWIAGGGGLRGYRGRAILGERLWALNLDLDTPRLPVSLFADLGSIETVGPALADAGIGYGWGPVRLTMPVWVGRPVAGEKPWRFRWLVSLQSIPIPF